MLEGETGTKTRVIHFRTEHPTSDVESTIQSDVYHLYSPLMRGRGRIVHDRGIVHDGDIRPGMLRIESPGERVHKTICSPGGWRCLILHIPGEEVRALLETERDQRGPSAISPLLRPHRQVEQLSAALLAVSEFDGKQAQLFVDGVTQSLLACLLNLPTSMQGSSKPREGGELDDFDFNRCVEYADAKMSDGLHLESWAGAIGMEPKEFARRFRHRTRQAPYTWFMSRRIDQAKQMLQDRRRPIADIALQVGFCSQSHFTEAFKRRAGCSPSRWRAMA